MTASGVEGPECTQCQLDIDDPLLQAAMLSWIGVPLSDPPACATDRVWVYRARPAMLLARGEANRSTAIRRESELVQER